jgi:hypothetical protein
MADDTQQFWQVETFEESEVLTDSAIPRSDCPSQCAQRNRCVGPRQ